MLALGASSFLNKLAKKGSLLIAYKYLCEWARMESLTREVVDLVMVLTERPFASRRRLRHVARWLQIVLTCPF